MFDFVVASPYTPHMGRLSGELARIFFPNVERLLVIDAPGLAVGLSGNGINESVTKSEKKFRTNYPF